MPTIVQSASGTAAVGPTTIVTMTSDVTAGNLLVVMTGHSGGADNGVFTDTQGLTFTKIVQSFNAGGGQSDSTILIAPITSSGPEVITRTFTSTNYPVVMWAVEILGYANAIVDSTNVGQTFGGTSVTSGNVTSSHADCLLIGMGSDSSFTSNVFDGISPSGGTEYFGGIYGAFVAKSETAGTYSCTFTKSATGGRFSAAAALLSSPLSFLLTDSESLSDSIKQNRGYLFSDSISYSDSALAAVTGAVVGGDLVNDYISLQDSASANFAVAFPPHRGNIDYDQIRVAARSGDGAKFHTLTGSITTGHGVIFDAQGNLVDAGSAPGSGTVSSVAQTVPSGFTVAGSPVTSSGTLAITADSQAANKFYASPSGSSGSPTFRVIAAADLPLASSSAFGAVKVDNTTITASAGVISAASSGALVLLEQHTASNSTELDFTSCISSTYDEYMIEVVSLVQSTALQVQIQMSTTGGSSYDTGSNYQWSSAFGYASSAGGTGSTSDTKIAFDASLTKNANTAYYGSLKLFDPLNTSLYKFIMYQFTVSVTAVNAPLNYMGSGYYKSTTAVNAFRFIASTGNFTSGTIRVYGVAK